MQLLTVGLFEHYGLGSREVQELMRLSSLSLVDRYTRSFRIRDKSIFDRGPDLSQSSIEQARATGTDDSVLAPCLALQCGKPRISTDSNGHKGDKDSKSENAPKEALECKKRALSRDKGGKKMKGGSRIRTDDSGFAIRRLSPLGHAAIS